MKFKAMNEKRNQLISEMEKLTSTAETEVRAMTEEEIKTFDEKRTEVENLDKTIKAMEEQRNFETKEINTEQRSAEAILDAFIKGGEIRAGEMSTTENGNIIPSKLSDDIVRKLKETSSIYNDVSKVAYPGVYKQIVENGKVAAGWTDELAAVTSSKSTFNVVDIGHHKLGALVKLSLEIVNQSHVSVVPEVQAQMERSFAEKIEEGIIKGTGVKQPEGLIKKGVAANLASKTAITADEIVTAFHKLKAQYLRNAKWIMNRATLEAIRKLKDTDGRYLFNDDLTKEYVGYILGKPVEITEAIDSFAATTTIILFGDFTAAYKVNNHPSMFIQVLRERYIDEGAIGVIGFAFVDGKVINDEAYVNVKTPA